MEHLADLSPKVQILDFIVPQKGEELADILKLVDTQTPVEQQHGLWSRKLTHRRHQGALQGSHPEQGSSARVLEQINDTPIRGGLQGFLSG